MFGFPFFLQDPKFQEAQRKRDAERRRERLKQAVPWDPKMKWQRALTLKHETWPMWNLFNVEPTTHVDVNHEKDSAKLALSPSGQFCFANKVFPCGETLAMCCGNRSGSVIFDGPTSLSSLHERQGDQWHMRPWMSMTPQEVFTLRPGIRLAKGHVVIAGLGLGWMLVEVLRKRRVEKVTLVERSKELVDWVMPALAPKILEVGRSPLDVGMIVGDAYDVVPKLTADVALIDIYKSYGGNDFLDEVYRKTGFERPKQRGCPNIKRVWSWGGAYAKGDD